MDDATADVEADSTLLSKTSKSGKLEEAASSSQEVGMKTVSIMTVNMNGPGGAKSRRELLTHNMSRFSASLIFAQEIPGHFEKEVVQKLRKGGYDYFSSGKSAVLWLTKEFQCERLKNASTIKIVENLQKYRSDVDVSEVRSRIALVKLRRKGEEASGCQRFLAASWHGPNTGKNKEGRKRTFEGLICFLRKHYEEEEVSCFIIGGDFNINTSDYINRNDVSVLKYELTSRARRKSGKGDNYTPYKDNFIVSNEPRNYGCIKLYSVRSLELENTGPDSPSCKDVLDHDPIVGELAFRPCKQTGECKVEIMHDLLFSTSD